MSANNRRIRRVIVDLLWEHGPITRNELAALLHKNRGIREVPSDTSLSSLLSKNVQAESVGFAKVENIAGIKTKHMIFDVRRDLIKSKIDIVFTRPPSCMSARERALAVRCVGCGRNRIMSDDTLTCLNCIREAEN